MRTILIYYWRLNMKKYYLIIILLLSTLLAWCAQTYDDMESIYSKCTEWEIHYTVNDPWSITHVDCYVSEFDKSFYTPTDLVNAKIACDNMTGTLAERWYSEYNYNWALKSHRFIWYVCEF
jgi:catabolite regulation protein CreA